MITPDYRASEYCCHIYTEFTKEVPGDRPTTGGILHNPAALGGVTFDERCSNCPSSRTVNRNGAEYDYGQWS